MSYGRLRINGGTKVTGDAGASLKIKETWNDASMTGYTCVVTIVDTASSDNSFLQSFIVNSSNIFLLRKDGAISLGINSATPWADGIGAMEAMIKPSTAPSTAAFSNSAIRWYDDTSKHYKFIDDTSTVRSLVNSDDVIAIAQGGTGQTTANNALNALLPSQTGNSGKVLQTNGTDTSWASVSSGASSLSATLTVGNTTGSNDIIISSGQKITSETNTNLVLQANGTGKVSLGDANLLFPDSDGTNGQSLITNGSGTLSWASVVTNTVGMLLNYKADSNTYTAPPASSYIRWDNATQISATNIYVSMTTSDGYDIDAILATLVYLDDIFIQQTNNSADYQHWYISGTPTGSHVSGYWTIPITLVSSGGTGTTGFANNSNIFLYVAPHGTRATLSSVLQNGNTTGSNDIIISSGQKITSETNTNLVLQANGSGKVSLGDANLLFPDSDGTNGQVLITNGSGTLSWTTVSSGSGTVTSVALSGGTTGLTVSGSPITTSGTITLAGTLAITNGGTGANTANSALNNLLPNQTGNNGKVLTTDGTDTSWITVSSGSGTVTSVALSGGTTGLTVSGSPITTSGTITLAGTLAIANGGTGQTTANNALNALLPSQTSNSGKYLSTNGTDTSWSSLIGQNTLISPVGLGTNTTITSSNYTTYLNAIIYPTASFTLTFDNTINAGFQCTVVAVGGFQVTFATSGGTLNNPFGFSSPKTNGNGSSISVCVTTTGVVNIDGTLTS